MLSRKKDELIIFYPLYIFKVIYDLPNKIVDPSPFLSAKIDYDLHQQMLSLCYYSDKSTQGVLQAFSIWAVLPLKIDFFP